MTLATVKIESEVMLSIHKNCRLCLSEESLSDALDEEGLQQWIRDYLSISISPEDGMSKSVCAICQIRLSEFHQFSIRCNEVQNVLQSMVQDKNAEPGAELSEEVDYDDGQERNFDQDPFPENRQQESHAKSHYEEAVTGQQIDLDNMIHVDDTNIEAFESEQILTANNSESKQIVVTDKVESFECEICHITRPSKMLLSRHNQRTHGEKKYECSKCEIGFVYQSALIKHLRSKGHKNKQKSISVDKSKDKSFKCDICGTSFKHKYNIKRHRELMHGIKTPTSLECDICKKVFKLLRSLTAHKRDVHGATSHIRPHNCELQSMVQDKNAEPGAELSEEVDYDNGQERSFDQEPFPEKQQRESHAKSHYEEVVTGQQIDLDNIIHVDDIKIEAFDSELTMTDNNSESKQIVVIDKVVSLECEICHLTWPSKALLHRHIKITHGERKYECSLCGIGFVYRSALNQHFKSQSHMNKQKGIAVDKPFKCDICGTLFQEHVNLKRHRKRMHGLKTPRSLECDICKKVFKLKRSLTIHKRDVHGAKRFKCDICPKAYKKLRDLKKHQKNVHGPKIYGCPVCSLSFITRRKLDHHMPVHADQSEEYSLKFQQINQNRTTLASQSQDEPGTNVKSDPDSENISTTGQQMGQDTAVLLEHSFITGDN